MTEAEWLACEDPDAMPDFLAGGEPPTARKARLFACACCRRVWGLLVKEVSRAAVPSAESYADGQLGVDALARLWEDSSTATGRLGAACDLARRLPAGAGMADWERSEDWGQERAIAARGYWYARAVAEAAVAAMESAGGASSLSQPGFVPRAAAAARRAVGYDHSSGADAAPADTAEASGQCALLRDVFGTPFRPVSIAPAWLTADVVQLAHAAYDQRLLPSGELDAQRLQVLADALEEAGCHSAELLEHLRGPGVHVRGCWVVDAVLVRP